MLAFLPLVFVLISWPCYAQKHWPGPASPAKAAGASRKAGIQWVSIPGGTLSRGEWNGAHHVKVNVFQMAKTEVTVEQYKACVDDGACTVPNKGDHCTWSVAGKESHPVNCVDWNQAKEFSEWVGGRLPTDAEWEYAAGSADRNWKYPWGNEEATCGKAVISEGVNGCGKDSTWPVCSKVEGNSEQGLCDLVGNVWEWVQDWYRGSPRDDEPRDGSAREYPDGSNRVFRGGAWTFRASYARVGLHYFPGYRADYLGFRPVR